MATPAPDAGQAPPAGAGLDPDGTTLKRFLRQLTEAEEAHAPRVTLWRRMDDAYRGEIRSLAGLPEVKKDYIRQVFPKYALAVVETIKAGIDDENPKLKIHPTIVDDEHIAGAKCLQELLDWQHKRLGYAAERSLFIDQALRRGSSIAKVPWVYETQKLSQRLFAQGPVSLDNPHGGKVQVGRTAPTEKVTKQGAGFKCLDITMCPWDPGATCYADVTHQFFKSYVTIDELRRMRDLGVYSWPAGEEPKPGGMNDTQVTSFGRPVNTKNRILLIERWEYTYEGVQLTVVTNKNQVIRDCPSPLEHGKIPFVFASTNPGLFTVDGMSEVELVMEEQAAIWELLNQSLMNARYQANAVWFIDETMKGIDDIKLGPGEMNLVPPGGNINERIHSFQPAQTLQFVQPLIEMLIQEMNAVSPSNPYMSGSDPDSTANATATGTSLIQNMAQKRIQRKKEEIQRADRETGLQQIQLNQQLLPAAVVWAVEDQSQAQGYTQVRVDPSEIQGEYAYDAEEIADAVSQAQRRQESSAMVGTLLQIQQVFAALPPGTQPIIDPVALVKDFTESYDYKPDKFLAGSGLPGAAPPAMAVPPPLTGPLPILGGSVPTPPGGAPPSGTPLGIPTGGGATSPPPPPRP